MEILLKRYGYNIDVFAPKEKKTTTTITFGDNLNDTFSAYRNPKIILLVLFCFFYYTQRLYFWCFFADFFLIRLNGLIYTVSVVFIYLWFVLLSSAANRTLLGLRPFGKTTPGNNLFFVRFCTIIFTRVQLILLIYRYGFDFDYITFAR